MTSYPLIQTGSGSGSAQMNSSLIKLSTWKKCILLRRTFVILLLQIQLQCHRVVSTPQNLPNYPNGADRNGFRFSLKQQLMDDSLGVNSHFEQHFDIHDGTHVGQDNDSNRKKQSEKFGMQLQDISGSANIDGACTTSTFGASANVKSKLQLKGQHDAEEENLGADKERSSLDKGGEENHRQPRTDIIQNKVHVGAPGGVIDRKPKSVPQAVPIKIPQPFNRINSSNRSASSNVTLSGNTLRTPSMKNEINKRMERGRITCDFGTQQSQLYGRSDSMLDKEIYPSMEKKPGKIRLSIDPNAVSRLIPTLLHASISIFAAFTATLRFLAPLVVSKRAIVSIGNLVSDWYTGRYLRKTYSRMEKIYIHYYETPATFRAMSRTMSQWVVYLILARIMGWMVGITHSPCRSEGRGLALFCGLLYLGSVTGTGHAFAEAVAIWGGPLRLQAVNHVRKPKVWKIFINPLHILDWMRNPEQWISMIAKPEMRPFDPNPLLFPATWIPLRLLQMVAVAKVVATEPDEYLWCSSEAEQVPRLIRKYLLQLALSDEWYRVFVREKRIGLGIGVAMAYYFAMLSLLVSSAMINGSATILMVPSLIAIIISTWMNVVIFWNRRLTRREMQRAREQLKKNEGTWVNEYWAWS